jgi:hypothetical protein
MDCGVVEHDALEKQHSDEFRSHTTAAHVVVGGDAVVVSSYGCQSAATSQLSTSH